MHTKSGQVISSATKWAHREPRPIHTPTHQQTETGKTPPDSPRGMEGGGGHIQGQSTLIINKSNLLKEQTAQVQ
jgi:hypothetical protein